MTLSLQEIHGSRTGAAWGVNPRARYRRRVEPFPPVDPHPESPAASPPARHDEPPPEFGVLPSASCPDAVQVSAAGEAVASSGDIEQSGVAATVPGAVPGAENSGTEADKDQAPSVWNRRSILLIAMAVIMALCSGAFGTGYVLYNRAAQPDRSSPSVVVTRYLEAALEQRNDDAAKGYTCADAGGFSDVMALLAEVKSQERRFGVRVTIRWDGFGVKSNGTDATVTATLRIQVPEASGAISESLQQWSFSLVKQSGWRVCAAHRVG